MKNSGKIVSKRDTIVGLFFILYFLYFIIFNPYHLVYLEQMQLFRFDWYYFLDIMGKPGGISEYSGAFLTQFFLNSGTGAFIVTWAGIVAYVLTEFILRKYRIYGMFWSFIPVVFLLALQSDHLYKFWYTIAFLLTLTFIAIYVTIKNDNLRYTTGFIGWFFLYLATGGFSLLAPAICIIHELLFTNKPIRYIVIAGYILMTILFPYLAWQYIYFIPFKDTWFNPILFLHNGIPNYSVIILLVYYPLLLTGIKLWCRFTKKEQVIFSWNSKTLLAGIIVLFALVLWVKKYKYDYRTELFFGIIEKVQQEKWDQVLKLSSKYPETHLLVIYATNLALYKSGHLGDRMFYYNQAGPAGLSLEWQNNNIIHLFGSEIFYHLGNNTEAYRWAFGRLVVDGPTPYSLKRLVLTSIIKGDYAIAEKYLNMMNQTLFYNKWAKHYLKYIENPELIINDHEITEKRNFLIHIDFLASADRADLGLAQLLENHPDNKMAFEYYMASLLLGKDIITFATNIHRIKDFGYKEIPVHFEEALLWYIGYSKKNFIPDGYTIREPTIKRFRDYFNAYNSYAGNPDQMVQVLNKSFGKTYWFYYHFANIQSLKK